LQLKDFIKFVGKKANIKLKNNEVIVNVKIEELIINSPYRQKWKVLISYNDKRELISFYEITEVRVLNPWSFTK
jgi:ribosome maturation factor RimP